MKIFLRRFFVPLVTTIALAAVPAAIGAPPQSVSITTPPNGSKIIVAPNSPVTFTATATSSGSNAAISSINFLVNGASIGTVVGGTSSVTLSTPWQPASATTYTLTAVASDSSSS